MEPFKSDKLNQRILILKLVPVFGLIINYLNINGKGLNSLGIVTAAKKTKNKTNKLITPNSIFKY